MRYFPTTGDKHILLTALFALGMAMPEATAQHAHVHGLGRVNIAVEGMQATVEFLAPAEGLYGFEHQPKTPAQQAKRDAALERLRTQLHTMVVFETARGCQATVPQVVVEAAGHEAAGGAAQQQTAEHSEVRAEFRVLCSKPLAGSKVTFGISKIFPALTTVRVQVVTDTGQRGVDITRDKGSITLQ